MKIRIFYFSLIENSINSDFESIAYNNHLALTLSVTKDSQKYSIFLIFGYANGTDIEIDIKKYINYNVMSNNNLVL